MPNTVLITGTSSGIGKQSAIYFAKQGWNVAATMRTPVGASLGDSPYREQDLQSYPNVRLYALDVTQRDSIQQAIAAAIADFGSIDVLVNNAGFGVDGVFEAMDDDMISQQFNTNVLGLMRVTRAIIPHLRKQGGGRIVQIASMGGRITFPLYSIYHSSKWAVEGFSESLHYELKPFNIQVKLIEPGAIKTEFYGVNRRSIGSAAPPAYQQFVDTIDKISQTAGNNGVLPEVVAKTIFLAATDRRGKLRYPVGYPAPLFLTLRKLLPDSWYFAFVSRIYGI
jgi:NAD(P)-dependent dehydrogenase (short-subunit alcohol dehydrogenase family)